MKNLNPLHFTFLKEQVSIFQFFMILSFLFLIFSGHTLSLPMFFVLYAVVLQVVAAFTNDDNQTLGVFWHSAPGLLAALAVCFLFVYLFVRPRTKIGDYIAIGAVASLFLQFYWVVESAFRYPNTPAFVLASIFLLLSMATLYGLISRVKSYAP